ncbi:oligosaccharide flippase family protein [Candidatus Roizmanbacteria bacterium]|nr:oligosaccharide flippase family protein [Candidatus Roizmanbacteria bacterium]
MEQTPDLKHLKKQTVFSTLSLFFQSGYSAFLGLAANFILTILLTPKIFGIYFTLLSINSLMNYFSDIGLAASLIQKKEITADDIKTTFTIQQLLVIATVLIAFSLTSFIISFYRLPPEGVYLYWAILLSFFLSSLKTIPSILLERKIQFHKIVLVQVIENTIFYATVSILAIMHFNLQSFTYATLLRAAVGVVIIYVISFWMPQLGVSRKSIKELLSFGLPFQASSFLALFKDDLIILYLGRVIGFEGLGYVGWAKKWAEAPIRIIMDNISRVLFPVFSRIQHNKEKISQLMEKVLQYQTAILAPAVFGSALTMRVLITLIPRYGKWAPALPLFYLFCISALLSTYSTPFINLFNALGKVKISLSFMAAWTIATWLLTTFLTSLYGIYGFPLTQVILASTFVLVIWQAKKLISFSFWRSVYKSLVSALGMAAVIFYSLSIFARTSAGILLAVGAGILTYYLILRFIFQIDLIREVRSLFIYE